jgi:hypothetical protein
VNTNPGKILNLSATDPNIIAAVTPANCNWYREKATPGMLGAVRVSGFISTPFKPAFSKLPINGLPDSEKAKEKPKTIHWH